jgi:hypothetical protein
VERRVNREVRQRGGTGHMIISIPYLVAYHSPQRDGTGDQLKRRLSGNHRNRPALRFADRS